jgi:hypothetical protein
VTQALSAASQSRRLHHQCIVLAAVDVLVQDSEAGEHWQPPGLLVSRAGATRRYDTPAPLARLVSKSYLFPVYV